MAGSHDVGGHGMRTARWGEDWGVAGFVGEEVHDVVAFGCFWHCGCCLDGVVSGDRHCLCRRQNG